MLNILLLAGHLLVTSNFMPTGPAPASVNVNVPAPAAVRTLMVTDAAPDNNFHDDGLQPEEREYVARVNAERVARGLDALALDPLLVETARAHSREMCSRDYFDHHSPSAGLNTPMDRYLSGRRGEGMARPDYALVGENIFYCSESSDTYNVAFGHHALMNSPGHRANILEARFAKIGVGIWHDAQGQTWVTQMFLRDTAPADGQ